MAQVSTIHSAEILPFPREAVRRSWKATRNSKRQTLYETTRGDLALLAHFADYLAGRSSALAKEAAFVSDVSAKVWEAADRMHRNLTGMGINEAPATIRRMHGPETDGGAA